MDVFEAVDSRRSARDFLNKPVPGDLLDELLKAAVRAPSGGNLQPWHIHVVRGESLDKLNALMRNKIRSGQPAEAVEYDIYPPNLKSPYRDRRFQVGEALYSQLKIPREDKAARREWFLRNFEFFGAPVGLFFTIDRSMGAPQWSDLGMIMQTLMFLARARGLDSCAQECWALYPESIGRFLELPESQMLFAGMAIGYANNENPVNQLRTDRAPFEDVLKFHN